MMFMTVCMYGWMVSLCKRTISKKGGWKVGRKSWGPTVPCIGPYLSLMLAPMQLLLHLMNHSSFNLPFRRRKKLTISTERQGARNCHNFFFLFFPLYLAGGAQVGCYVFATLLSSSRKKRGGGEIHFRQKPGLKKEILNLSIRVSVEIYIVTEAYTK